MKKTIFFLLAICVFIKTEAQKNAGSDKFPENWKGNWQGTLEIFNNTGKIQSVPMQLQISGIDSVRYTFTLIYGAGEKVDKRLYELQAIDRKKGLYVIDEKNSIRIEGYLFGEKLVYHFSVQETYLVISYQKTGNELIFEVISGKELAISTTGGQKYNDEDIPMVKTFPVMGWQKAVLKRK